MNNKKICVLGANGLVGSALVRSLEKKSYTNIIAPKRGQLDLLAQEATKEFFAKERPEVVILAAAKLGGIKANNTFRADFILQNLQIQNNVIEACFKAEIKNVIFLASSCVYPKESLQPIKEEYLLTGPLEKTIEPYALAKIAGIKLIENFARQYGSQYFSLVPCNVYGPGESFDPDNSHVIAGLIRRMYEAKVKSLPEFKVWGTGKPRREFLFTDDLADGIVHFAKEGMEISPGAYINIGYGDDIQISDLVNMVAETTGYKGSIVFDTTQPDGTMKKLVDSSRIFNLGWKPKVTLPEGIKKTYEYFLNSKWSDIKSF